MSAVLIYITAGSRDEALTLARVLVEERLLACANVLAGVSSVYWWQGTVQEETEAVMIGKTQATLADAVITRVRTLHSYACPCVIAVPITAGNPAFLDWLTDETRLPSAETPRAVMP